MSSALMLMPAPARIHAADRSTTSDNPDRKISRSRRRTASSAEFTDVMIAIAFHSPPKSSHKGAYRTTWISRDVIDFSICLLATAIAGTSGDQGEQRSKRDCQARSVRLRATEILFVFIVAVDQPLRSPGYMRQ